MGQAEFGKQTQVKAPQGWGCDGLTEFLETAHQNRFATFANKTKEFQRLASIDECFSRIEADWINPPNLVTPLLFFRSHAAFRATCEHAMSGQIVDTFVSIRNLIETAGYALHIHRNPGLDQTWLRRHDDEGSMKKVKSAFKISSVRKSIHAANSFGEDVFGLLYERSIDFGGHPNERAITGSLSHVEEEARSNYRLSLLQGDGLPLDHALKSAAQAGVCALDILGDVFSARYELLGVRERMPALKVGL